MRLRVCSRREVGADPARGATESLTRRLLPQMPTKSRSPLSLPAPGRSLDGGHHEGGSAGSPGEVSGGDERASTVAPRLLATMPLATLPQPARRRVASRDSSFTPFFSPAIDLQLCEVQEIPGSDLKEIQCVACWTCGQSSAVFRRDLLPDTAGFGVR